MTQEEIFHEIREGYKVYCGIETKQDENDKMEIKVNNIIYSEFTEKEDWKEDLELDKSEVTSER